MPTVPIPAPAPTVPQTVVSAAQVPSPVAMDIELATVPLPQADAESEQEQTPIFGSNSPFAIAPSPEKVDAEVPQANVGVSCHTCIVNIVKRSIRVMQHIHFPVNLLPIPLRLKPYSTTSCLPLIPVMVSPSSMLLGPHFLHQVTLHMQKALGQGRLTLVKVRGYPRVCWVI